MRISQILIDLNCEIRVINSVARWVLTNADTTTIVNPDEAIGVIRQIIKKLDLYNLK